MSEEGHNRRFRRPCRRGRAHLLDVVGCALDRRDRAGRRGRAHFLVRCGIRPGQDAGSPDLVDGILLADFLIYRGRHRHPDHPQLWLALDVRHRRRLGARFRGGLAEPARIDPLPHSEKPVG